MNDKQYIKQVVQECVDEVEKTQREIAKREADKVLLKITACIVSGFICGAYVIPWLFG